MYDKTFQAKVWPILFTAFETHIAPVFNGRLSWKVASKLTPIPYGVYQSQDGGGKNNDYIGQNGWEGLVTIRCMDTTLSGAYSKMFDVTSALDTLDHPNYTIGATVIHPIELPVEKLSATENVYTAAIVTDITIHPKT